MPEKTPRKPLENGQILLVDKPKGISSYDAIRRLKKRFPGAKIGHAGRLGPNASGLLLVGVGSGTKKLTEFLKLPKEYAAEVLFGLRTNTGDVTGRAVATGDAEHLTIDMVRNAVSELVGKHAYMLPAYSAVKQGGVPLYKKARRGEIVVPPVREMEVLHAKVEEFSKPDHGTIDCTMTLCGNYALAKVTFYVASGTYIRTLAEELGKKLKVPATLKELRRIKIGEFKIENAETVI